MIETLSAQVLHVLSPTRSPSYAQEAGKSNLGLCGCAGVRPLFGGQSVRWGGGKGARFERAGAGGAPWGQWRNEWWLYIGKDVYCIAVFNFNDFT
jgi:hypothetical protein